ncbi:FAD-binding oxidoreductase [Actinoplanes sp. NEAU-A12]|uniref:FAD-binding oxidoreductase n=1 Tax=Actinoplanes sandaracinus TaxID=3045177 RepID=A0ABT6X198_9ACTN|nr:FAD-binding oxidoreductase [Actinoplanes sandaracinus]MDI6105777.1 FAD-binding oxidoreductase [Actinoplanes sandaracinus]
MSSGSGPASDPHLLGLLRAIRLRQNAPDATAAGEADTAAALSDITARKKKTEDQETGEKKPASDTPYFSGRTPSSAAGKQPQRNPGANPGLLWRGDPRATLGRSGLQARGAVPPIGGITPSGPTTPVPNIPPVSGGRSIGESGTDFPPGQFPSAPSVPSVPRRSPFTAGKGGPNRDGMDPADDASLRETQRLLSNSLTFAGGTEDVAVRLWQALRQAQPALFEALPGSPETQQAQLARALTWLVHQLNEPPALVSGCTHLGAALTECGIQWNQLHLVGAALVEATRAGMSPSAWRQDFDQAWRWTWQHIFEWIVHGGTLTAYQPTIWDTEVVEHDLRRADLAVLRLRPDLPMPYRPGQYARFELPAVPGVWRPYSPASAPHRDDLIELHVRAKTQNGVSGTLVHRTRPGDRIRVTRAEGDMTLPAQQGRGILMIAGDTGVAPMKAMLAELAATGDTRQAVLFWGVRDLTELYDIDALNALAAQIPRATVVPIVAEGDPGPYLSGLVTDAVAAYGEWSRHEIYLAGPPLMIASTAAALEHLGIPAAQIHHDPPE